jgi:DSF synthase
MTYLQKKFGAPTLVNDAGEAPDFAAATLPNQSLVPAHVEVASQNYDNLAVEIDPETRTYWCTMLPQGRGSFSPGLLQDMRGVQRSIKRMFTERAHEAQKPFDYFVVNSRVPGTFNLGGDLGLFADKIRAGDREALRDYAYTCIKVVHTSHISFEVPVVTMALVQGDALGGGFECALSMDMIVAERGAKLGLPEIMFNLFPGMGAYSFLSRRLDATRAEKMILSGKVYGAEELHEMGIVDILAEDGQGEEAVREYIDRHAYRLNAYRAVYQARKRINPVTFEELRDVTDIWVEAAMGLSESDLRRMARLTAAQDRRRLSQKTAGMVSLSAE